MSSCAALSLLDAGGNDHRLLAVVAGGLARRHRKFAASRFVVNVKDGRPPVHLCKVFRHSKCARQLPSIVFNVQINHSLNIVHHAPPPKIRLGGGKVDVQKSENELWANSV